MRETRRPASTISVVPWSALRKGRAGTRTRYQDGVEPPPGSRRRSVRYRTANATELVLVLRHCVSLLVGEDQGGVLWNALVRQELTAQSAISQSIYRSIRAPMKTAKLFIRTATWSALLKATPLIARLTRPADFQRSAQTHTIHALLGHFDILGGGGGRKSTPHALKREPFTTTYGTSRTRALRFRSEFFRSLPECGHPCAACCGLPKLDERSQANRLGKQGQTRFDPAS